REERLATAGGTNEAAARTHRITRGETLSHVARRYGVTVAALRSANGNISPTRLRVGQALRIPAGGSGPALASAAPQYHRVQRGENLTVIARRYNTSVRQLRAWNGLGSSSRILAGQRLRVNG